MTDASLAFWTKSEPRVWPSSPRWMSVSTLSELESCPRRWALGAADYPSLWDGNGYPRPLHLPALEGSVVHQSLETILHALVDARCTSLADQCAVETLRRLGGFSEIVASTLRKQLQREAGNPRSSSVRQAYADRLASRIPILRAKVQRLLARVGFLVPREELTTIIDKDKSHAPRGQALSGTHTEVTLRADDLGWIGIADLVAVSGEHCEIRDYKTGLPSDGHEFQLQVYAWLWSKDREANPKGTLADSLVISYDDHDVRVAPPTAEDLRALEDELKRRTTEAVSGLRADPPAARPKEENCSICTVRHLCDDYWSWDANTGRDGCQGDSPEGSFGDVELMISGRHGPSSWDAFTYTGSDATVGVPVLLRIRELPFDLRPQQRVRVLDAYKPAGNSMGMGDEDRDEVAVVTMGARSELFLVG